MSTCDTRYWECFVAVWLWRIVPVFFIVIGSFGNAAIIVVYARREMRKISTSIYLLSLGISDFFLLWTTVLEQTLVNGYGIDYRSVTHLHCRTLVWVAYTFGGFSAFTVMNVTIERAFMLTFPIKAKSKLTPKVAFIVCLATAVTMLCLTAHFIYGHAMRVEEVTNGADNSTYLKEKCMRSSESIDHFYSYTWDFVALLFFNVIPLCVIFIGNILICCTIRSSRRKIHNHTDANIVNIVHSSKPTMDKGMTIVKILFIISFGFTVTTMPYFIYFIVRDSYQEAMTPRVQAVDAFVYSIIHILLYSNFCFDFFVYITMSTLFKKGCKQVLRQICAICKKK